MPIKTLTDNNFHDSIKNGVAIVDFWAIWCGPCRLMTPVVENVAKEMPDIKVFKLNVDDYPQLTADFNILSIPTIIIFKDGKQVDKCSGVSSKSVLMNKIKNYM